MKHPKRGETVMYCQHVGPATIVVPGQGLYCDILFLDDSLLDDAPWWRSAAEGEPIIRAFTATGERSADWFVCCDTCNDRIDERLRVGGPLTLPNDINLEA